MLTIRRWMECIKLTLLSLKQKRALRNYIIRKGIGYSYHLAIHTPFTRVLRTVKLALQKLSYNITLGYKNRSSYRYLYQSLLFNQRRLNFCFSTCADQDLSNMWSIHCGLYQTILEMPLQCSLDWEESLWEMNKLDLKKNILNRLFLFGKASFISGTLKVLYNEV